MSISIMLTIRVRINEIFPDKPTKSENSFRNRIIVAIAILKGPMGDFKTIENHIVILANL